MYSVALFGKRINILQLIVIVFGSLFLISFLINKIKALFNKLKTNYSLGEQIYNVLVRIPLLSHHLVITKNRVKKVILCDEKRLRAETILFMCKPLILSSVIFLILETLNSKTVYGLIVNIFIALILYNSFLDKSLDKLNKILEPLKESLQDIANEYASFKDIERAFKNAISDSESVVQPHLMEIKRIICLPESQAEAELKNYCKKEGNKVLRLLAMISFATKKQGDQTHKGNSLYHDYLNFLIREVHMDIRKQKYLKLKLSGNQYFIIVSLLILPFLKKGGINIFGQIPDVGDFYNSTNADILMIICAIISVVLYLIYKKVVTISDIEIISEIKQNPTIDRLLNINWITKFINLFVPRSRSKKHINLIDLMTKAGKIEDLHSFFLKKVLLFISIFLASMIVLFSYHTEKKLNILNSEITKNKALDMMTAIRFDGFTLSNKEVDIIKTLSKDKELNVLDQEKAIKYIEKTLSIMNGERLIDVSNVLYQKVIELKKEKITFIEIFIVLLISLIFYNFPDMSLFIESNLRESLAPEEILTFQTIIILLIHNKLTTIEDILRWMLSFSNVFYVQLRSLLNKVNNGLTNLNIERGEIEKNNFEVALNDLMSVTKYKQLRRILKSILHIKRGMEVRAAFAGLEQEHNFSEELRKDMIDEMLDVRVLLGSYIVNVSLIVVVGIYLLLPIMYFVFTSFLQKVDYTKDFM